MTRLSRWPLANRIRQHLLATGGGAATLCRRFRPSLEPLEDRTLPAVGITGPVIDLTAELAMKPDFSFATIQAAVDAASPGDTILVSPGTYPESVTIDTPGLTLEGANYGINPTTGTRGAESIVDTSGIGGLTPFYVTASNVTIAGFTIEGATSPNQLGFGIVLGAGTSGANISNNIVQDNIAGLSLANAPNGQQAVIQDNLFQNNNEPGPAFGTGIYTDEFNSGGNLANVLIDGNTFTNNQGYALDFDALTDGGAPYDSNVTISNNDIDANWAGIFLTSASSVAITGNTISNSTAGNAIYVGGGVNGLAITGNTITGNPGAINVGPDFSGGSYSQPSSNITVALNNITDNNPFGGVQVTVADGRYSGTLNASGNWWGTTLGTSPSATTNAQLSQIAALTSGPVAIGSFLDSGSNTATVGFTPASSTQMWVPRTAATTGLAVVDGNIQDAVNAAAPGMTVSVAADTYAESLTITQPVTIQGAQAGLETLPRLDHFTPTTAGAKANPTLESILTPPAGSPISALVRVLAGDVTFDGLVFDGNSKAGDAITNRDGTGKLVPVYEVTVQNSVLQNFTGSALDLEGTASPTFGNQFLGNMVSNVQNFALQGAPTLLLSPEEVFLQPGKELTRPGTILNPGPGWTELVDYQVGSPGDPGFQPVAVNADGSFELDNIYATQGLHLVTLEVRDLAGNTSTSSFYLTVLNGAPEVAVSTVTATQIVPNQTAMLNLVQDPNTGWTTSVSYTHTGSGPATLQTLLYGQDPTGSAGNGSPPAIEWLDVQGLNVTNGDQIIVQISGIGHQPASITFIDPATGKPVTLNELPGDLPPSDSSQQGWTYQPDTLTIYLSAGTNPSEVNITGTVFVISLNSTTQQNVTVSPALASASNVADAGLEQTATFISRTQLTVTLTASQDRQLSSSTSSNQSSLASASNARVRRGGPQDDDENPTDGDPGFWQKFTEEYKNLLESLKMPAQSPGGSVPTGTNPVPAQGQHPRLAPDQPSKAPEQDEEPSLPQLAPPPADDQPLSKSPWEGKEIVPAETLALQVGPIATETDLFGQALLAGAMTFPLYALSQETTRKRQTAIPSIALPC